MFVYRHLEFINFAHFGSFLSSNLLGLHLEAFVNLTF